MKNSLYCFNLKSKWPIQCSKLKVRDQIEKEKMRHIINFLNMIGVQANYLTMTKEIGVRDT